MKLLGLLVRCALFSAYRSVFASSLGLVERDTIPAALSISPSQGFDGSDGPWSSFSVRCGTEPQTMRVLISTASSKTVVVAPNGCPDSITKYISECVDQRGGVFTNTSSSTWKAQGYYGILVEENLGINRTAFFGNDTISLGLPGSGGPTLENQVLGTTIAAEFSVGFFGVNPKPLNWTTMEHGQPSYITTLKEKNIIPSVSFGYTAGNQYRLKKVLGSLTLGGYDAARFEPNPIVFNFAPDNSRDIVVGIRSISTDYKGKRTSLLGDAILSYIDSTVPEIWLPTDACTMFEKTFGLIYDSDFQGYYVNDSLRSTLLDANPTVTLTIGDNKSGGPTINIALPYKAFDLVAKWPRTTSVDSKRYYPLKRAANDTQYTLGRTFLQEAYLFVDWERQTFTVSKATFDDKPNIQQLVNVLSPGRSNDTSSSTSGGSSGNSSTIGIAVGVTLGVVLIIAIIVFCLLRRRRKQRRLARYEREQEKKGDSSNGNEQFAKPELHTGIENSVFEAPGTEPSNLDSTPITPRFLGTGELFGSKVTKHSELPTSDYLTVPRELHSNHIVAPVELEGSTPGHAELEGTSSGGTPLVAGQDTPGVSPSRHSDIRSDVSPLRSSENSPYFGARGGRNARTSSVEASPLSLPMEHPSPMSPSSEGPPLRRPHEPRRMDTMDSLPSLPSPLPREDGYQRFPTDRVDEGDETK